MEPLELMRSMSPPAMKLDGDHITFVAVGPFATSVRGDRFIVDFMEQTQGGKTLKLSLPIASAGDLLRNLAAQVDEMK
jgi:hypothetical protein